MGSLYNWGKPGAQPGQFVLLTGDKEVTQDVGAVADRAVLNEAGYYKPGEWNEFTIVARGSHLLQRINGYLVAELVDNGPDTRRQGLLGLQVHAGHRPFLNEYKDIRLRQFDTKFGDARLLFNGKDLIGWTLLGRDAENVWTVEDGVLVNNPASAGYIRTKGYYDNYVLRFQYRRHGKQESCVVLSLLTPKDIQTRFIRICGWGDDFDHVQPVGGFAMKLKTLPANAPSPKKLPEGFWNECEITLNKGQLDVKVNGVLRAKALGCEQIPGSIAFMASRGRVEYRNIVLVPIL
jgi:hypothetical protein